MIPSNYLIPIIILLWYIFAYIYIVFIWNFKSYMYDQPDYIITILGRAILWILSPVTLPIIMLFKVNIK